MQEHIDAGDMKGLILTTVLTGVGWLLGKTGQLGGIFLWDIGKADNILVFISHLLQPFAFICSITIAVVTFIKWAKDKDEKG